VLDDGTDPLLRVTQCLEELARIGESLKLAVEGHRNQNASQRSPLELAATLEACRSARRLTDTACYFLAAAALNAGASPALLDWRSQ
jgi:hypothetical protein